MKKKLRALAICLAAILFVLSFASCSGDTKTESKVAFDTSKGILVISREEGSGARGAFIELMKIEVKNADGTKKDNTTTEAIVASKTDLVLSQVSANPYTIGYVSLGSVNDTVKTVKVDGVAVSAETIKDGTYKISRPFFIATNGEATGLKKDFIDFTLSKQGQDVAYANKTVRVNDNAPEYKSANLTGKLVIAGSSSVTPLMEKLKEAYVKLNPNVNVEVQQSDSSAGIKAAISNTCDIAMSSRALKDDEKAKLIPVRIAMDGIAVIINKNNTTENIAVGDITKIYTGALTKWNELGK